MSKTWQPATVSARAAIETDSQHHAVVPPIHLSSTFAFRAFGDKGAYDYTRSGNPTRDALAGVLAELEGGCGAVVTSSGMSAVALALQLVRPGELVIAPHDCYGGTYRLLEALARRQQLRVEFVDQSQPESLRAACALKPRLVWVETPSNPLLRIVDIRAVSRLCQAVGALLVVDNTFLSPGWQRPIDFGADIVVHSTTKYLNGHSDVVGGALVTTRADLQDELVWWGNCLGVTGAPFDSYLTLRGLRTLQARLRVHEENAQAVVTLLSSHAAIQKVYYPGISTHPGHSVAAAQQRAFGAMVSFELSGGLPAVTAFANGLACFSLAESLGGVESLVAHPASMTHAAMNAGARVRAGISDSLLRLSIGIEDKTDLLADLAAGLARAAAAGNVAGTAQLSAAC